MRKSRLLAVLAYCCGFAACGSGDSKTTGNLDALPVPTGTGGTTGIDADLAVGGSSGSGGSVGYDAATVPGDACPSLAGDYAVTTQIISTTCRLGLNTITPSTYTFTQVAPSCQFTMTNSIYSGSVYAGHFVMAGASAKVTWDSVVPPPTSVGYSLTYTAEDLTITPGATAATSTLSGTFSWHSGAGCDGTTNVCSGTVAAGCPTPQ
jgi:hypothetical protein